MSDKNLTELEWKKFAKGRALKDSAFVKALADLHKAGAPDQVLAALDDIDKQAGALRKSAKGDKELAAYLDDLDKALDKRRKLATAQARQATRDEAPDDEEETPALLTTKMVPLLRQVKKGEEMQVLLASTGKEVAVMLSRRAIAPSRRKLLTAYLDGATAKFFPGTCVFEEAAYTFVLKTQAAGMAKKIKAALLQQVELRLKVRVRGEDPNDVDEDGDPAEDDGAASQGAPEDRPAVRAPDPVAPVPAAPADPLQDAYTQRMALLEPRVLAALKAPAADASRIRAVVEFARGKAETGLYKAALAALDTLDKLLTQPAPAAPAAAAAAAAPAAGDEAAAFNARLAALLPQVKSASAAGLADASRQAAEAGALARQKALAQAHAVLDALQALLDGGAQPPAPGADVDDDLPLDTDSLGRADVARFRGGWRQTKAGWLDASEAVDAQLARLQSKLRADPDPELQQIAEFGLNGVSGNFKVPLMAAIRALDGAGDDGQKLAALLERAADAADAFKRHLQSAETVAACDDNPFGVAVSIRATLVPALDQLAQFATDMQAA